MLDVLLLVAFVALPILIWFLSRSVTFLVVGLILGYGLAGNLVQSLISLGVAWNVRGLQVLILLVMGALAVGAWYRRRSQETSLRTQVIAIAAPALVIGVGLVLLRLMAPDDPGALTAIGYFLNHPLAEDNAKWLHLSAQVADGRSISFNGYAGGPLLLMMATFSPLISALSMVWLGGVNQLAVATNSVLAVQFFLIAAVPFAFAPFVSRGAADAGDGPQLRVPMPAIWIGSFFLALASAVVTSYGHLSQQFTFIILALWIAAFLARAPRWILLATSLAVATSVSVWVPLNVLGLAILVAAVVISLRLRWWGGLAAALATVAMTFDAIFSSISYLLGIQVTLSLSAIDGGQDGQEEGAAPPPGSGELISSAHLFRAPGAAEQASAVLAVLAVVSVLGAAWLLAKRFNLVGPAAGLAVAPLGVLLGYTVAMMVADALVTGSSPNYGVTKMVFTAVVAAIAACLPLAVMAVDPVAEGMSFLRWVALAGVVAVLLVDSLFPRAVSALSPLLWQGVDENAPVYWAAAEVKDTGDQPLDSTPIACLFAPPEADQPTALPLGQESYACTRLLIGVAGVEGDAATLGNWLLTDWQSQSINWEEFRDSLTQGDEALRGRGVILMREGGGLAGLTTVGDLIDRNPVAIP